MDTLSEDTYRGSGIKFSKELSLAHFVMILAMRLLRTNLF